MVDLSRILPNDWRAPKQITPPDIAFMEAARDAGLEIDHIIPDGEIHRVRGPEDKAGRKSGWYVYYSDSIPGGCYGDWKTGFESTWFSREIDTMPPIQRQVREQQIARARRERDKLKEEAHEAAADQAELEISQLPAASASHPYLLTKHVRPHGIYQQGDILVIPIKDINGQIQSLQRIMPNGDKLYMKGGKKAGGMHLIGVIRDKVYICEGYATGATIYEATGTATACAFDAGSLMAVAKTVRVKHPTAQIIVCADNDDLTAGNPGLTKGAEAAEAVGGKMVFPVFESTDGGPTDFNDLACREGIAAVIKQVSGSLDEPQNMIISLSELLDSDYSTDYLIDGYLVEHGVNQIFGESGHKKSFVALDMAMHVAAGREWHGKPVKQGAVLYVVGEDLGGFKLRASAWLRHHRIKPEHVPIYFRVSAVPFPDQAATAQLSSEISAIGGTSLVILDTKARCMDGNENSTEDANAWIAAVDAVKAQHMATFLVVHHTGHMEKDRSRGAYSFLAALDSEYKVTKDATGGITLSTIKPPKNDEPPEDIYFDCLSVVTPYTRKGQPATSLVLALADRPSTPIKLSKRSQSGLDLLRQLYDEASENMRIQGRDPADAKIQIETWRTAFMDTNDGKPDTLRKTFNRIRADLERAGAVKIDGFFVLVCDS